MMSPIQSNWSRVPWRSPDGETGAEIHDQDRDVIYRATVHPERGELAFLAVEVRGHIDDNVLRRVPVARIRREVLAQIADDAQARAEAGHGDVFTIVPPGGLSGRPTLEEVAQLLEQGRDRAWFHAAYSDVPKRTVDGWMRRARQKYPSATPNRGGTSQPPTSNEKDPK